MYILALYVAVVIGIILYSALYFTVQLKIGKPPIKELFIAYKYCYLGRYKTFQFLKNSLFSQRSHKFVKLCYLGTKAKHLEFAQGVVLTENGDFPDFTHVSEAKRIGLNFFSTPFISHAIYVELSLFSCFFISKLFAILIGYPKIRQFCEKNNLCAYPVLEIYSSKSITIIVPLARQDGFVVNEAEGLVYGKWFTASYGIYLQDSKLKHEVEAYYLRNWEENLNTISGKSLKVTKRIMKG